MSARIASCIVVETVTLNDRTAGRQINCSRDLLPWADPYIALLAARHQQDHRRRRPARIVRAEAQPPVFPWTDYEVFRPPADRSSPNESAENA